MTVKDVIALGKMGYSKKEVEELLATDNSKVENETQELIEKLEKEVNDLTEIVNMRATHEPVEKQGGEDEKSVDDILKGFLDDGKES